MGSTRISSPIRSRVDPGAKFLAHPSRPKKAKSYCSVNWLASDRWFRDHLTRRYQYTMLYNIKQPKGAN